MVSALAIEVIVDVREMWLRETIDKEQLFQGAFNARGVV
jgi:hypothetical protein